ncbi:hypothetical protein [Terrabacter sp. C0L_2]|uniref:hypothetical protein n=1 Tax=Terrabacter sp. C0L_2 TaxID=3108389 RepID=UPI002ED6A738|nr:hypothetical protein U5C87_17610 [Terrabacter sp. C0L_2]
MTPQQRRERRWDRAIAAKVALGFALATVAPVVAIIADRARVYRNTIRLGKRA